MEFQGRTVLLTKLEDYKGRKKGVGKTKEVILNSNIKLGANIQIKRFNEETGKEKRPITISSVIRDIVPLSDTLSVQVRTDGSLYKIALTK